MDLRTVRRAALLSIAGVVASACAGLLAVDRWVAWLDRHMDAGPPGLLVEHESLGWVNRPDFRDERVSTDGLGLRNPAIPADAPAAELRLLCLGDSRIHGSGVGDDEVFSRRLELDLRAEGREARVLNGGVNSYTTQQCVWRGLELLDAVEPDVVLLFISPGWTLRPNLRVGDWATVGGELVPGDVVEGWPAALRPVPAALHRAMTASHLYVRHRTVLRRGGEVLGSARHFVLSRAPPPPEVAPFVDGTRETLSLLARESERRGIAVRAVLLPETFQIAPHVWERYLADNAASGAPPPGTGPFEPMAALQDLVGRAGLRAWVLYEEIQRFMSDVDRYYQADEAHWNPAGHRAVAETLRWYLAQDGLLDRPVVPRPRAAR